MVNVLAATDLSSIGDRALIRAARLANSLAGHLHVVHVVEGSTTSLDYELHREAVHARVASAVGGLLGRRRPRVAIGCGDPADWICRASRRFGIKMIVVGAHGKSDVRDALLGATAVRLLRSMTKPVLIVRQPAEQDYRRAVIAVENEADCAALIPAALDLPGLDRLFILHGRSAKLPDSLSRAIDAAVSRCRDSGLAIPKISIHTDEQGPISALTRHWGEFEPDLLVIGTQARTGLARIFYGSDAEAMIRALPIDILAMRTTAAAPSA